MPRASRRFRWRRPRAINRGRRRSPRFHRIARRNFARRGGRRRCRRRTRPPIDRPRMISSARISMSGAGLSPSKVSRPTIASTDTPPPFRSNQRCDGLRRIGGYDRDGGAARLQRREYFNCAFERLRAIDSGQFDFFDYLRSMPQRFEHVRRAVFPSARACGRRRRAADCRAGLVRTVRRARRSSAGRARARDGRRPNRLRARAAQSCCRNRTSRACTSRMNAMVVW